MKRRLILLLGALSPIALFTSRYWGAREQKASPPTDYGQQAEELNQLASTIQTLADARRFVDFVADLFCKEAPSAWTNDSVRRRVAQAEFAAVSDQQHAIPESRVAEAWNSYVETIGAPEDQKVAPPEIHNLRDAFLASARSSWNRGYRNFWLTPSIYATLPDGGLAPGCRAVESVRLLWDFTRFPGNIEAARDRASRSELLSDSYPKPSQASAASPTETARISGGVRNPYPMELAQRNYIQMHGNKAFSRAVMAMLTETLS